MDVVQIDGAHPLIVSLVDFDRNSDDFPSMWSRKQCMGAHALAAWIFQIVVCRIAYYNGSKLKECPESFIAVEGA